MEEGLFQRTELLLGTEIMEKLSRKKVIIFGIGGVGSWCAESLIRTGIKNLTIVDSDRISMTNVNRQLHATTATIGEVKTDILKRRLLEINPNAQITDLQQIYSRDNAGQFALETYDYIIDAIDSLENKVDLIRVATQTNATFFSSMGASLKLDPTRIKVTEFWKVNGCPLGAAVRRKMRKGELPAKKFLCVYSDELLTNNGKDTTSNKEKYMNQITNTGPGNPELLNHEWSNFKAQINGTVVHVTAVFGFTLAGLVIQDIVKNIHKI